MAEEFATAKNLHVGTGESWFWPRTGTSRQELLQCTEICPTCPIELKTKITKQT